MKKWNTETIKIAKGPKSIVPDQVEAEVLVGKGLAVHESFKGSDAERSGLLWTVTHVASGKRVRCFTTRAFARRFADRISTITDWNAAEEVIANTQLRDKDFFEKMNAAFYTPATTRRTAR